MSLEVHRMSPLLIVLFIGLLNFDCYQCLRFHSYFGDGMVLQRDKPVQVWGYDDLMNDVVASLECVSRNEGRKSHEEVVVESLAGGIWKMELPSRSAENQCDIEVKCFPFCL